MALANTSDYTWCYRGPDPDTTVVFNWTIDNFFSRTLQSSKSLLSDQFHIKDKVVRFELFPRGQREKESNFIV